MKKKLNQIFENRPKSRCFWLCHYFIIVSFVDKTGQSNAREEHSIKQMSIGSLLVYEQKFLIMKSVIINMIYCENYTKNISVLT